jgi:hypothetical protein
MYISCYFNLKIEWRKKGTLCKNAVVRKCLHHVQRVFGNIFDECIFSFYVFFLILQRNKKCCWVSVRWIIDLSSYLWMNEGKKQTCNDMFIWYFLLGVVPWLFLFHQKCNTITLFCYIYYKHVLGIAIESFSDLVLTNIIVIITIPFPRYC